MNVEETQTGGRSRVEDMRRRRQEEREFLTELLDQTLRDDSHIFVSRSKMGSSDSFVGTATFRWIDKNIGLFTELPLLKDKIDENGNLIIDEESIEDLRQRAPHWDRQYALTNYLLRQRHRQFPPILVVVTQPWVSNSEADEWGEDDRAKVSSMPIEYLDSDKRLGLIDFRSGVSAYAIDGAHRTIAVKGLMRAVGPERRLPILNRAKKEVDSKSIDEVLDQAGLKPADIVGIEDESMGVEFIPAVMEGETREEARIRVRSIFVHVNKTAVTPTAGEQVVLDEDNGFAIITRRVGLNHKLFHRDRAGDRINWKSGSIPASSKHWLVPAVTLTDMAQGFLGAKDPYTRWVAGRREIALRPPDDQLDAGEKEFMNFFDRLGKLPSFAEILRGDDVSDWREFPDPKKGISGKGHLLMRPLGQLVLARALGYLAFHPDGPQQSLNTMFTKLARYDEDGGFENVYQATSVWFGVTYNPLKAKMEMSGQKVAIELMRYLLGGLEPADRDELEKNYREFRTIDTGDGSIVARNWDGEDVKDPEKIKLPPLI